MPSGAVHPNSNPRAVDVSETSTHLEFGGYWIARSSRAMSGRGNEPYAFGPAGVG
jgi:hypothetical protein